MTSSAIDAVDWFALTNVVLVSGQIPVRPEYFPGSQVSQGSLTPSTGGVQGGSASYTQSISQITDVLIVPDQSLTGSNFLVYFPTAEYRRIDMTSSDPLVRVDMQFQTKNKQAQLAQLMLEPGSYLDVKVLFEMKPMKRDESGEAAPKRQRYA